MYQWWNENRKISIQIFETCFMYFLSSFQIQKEILQYQKKKKFLWNIYKVALKYNINKNSPDIIITVVYIFISL